MAFFQLSVLTGDKQVREYEFAKDEMVLGRSVDCDVVIPSLCAGRRHARIRREGSQFYVEDLNSRGGTRVNGPGISNQITGRTLLQDGDTIWFGSDVVVQFRS
jgi:pSer/pThr/pTyr-binding forkhead associated (FHA) protein